MRITVKGQRFNLRRLTDRGGSTVQYQIDAFDGFIISTITVKRSDSASEVRKYARDIIRQFYFKEAPA